MTVWVVWLIIECTALVLWYIGPQLNHSTLSKTTNFNITQPFLYTWNNDLIKWLNISCLSIFVPALNFEKQNLECIIIWSNWSKCLAISRTIPKWHDWIEWLLLQPVDNKNLWHRTLCSCQWNNYWIIRKGIGWNSRRSSRVPAPTHHASMISWE